jgi:hypothetical protein
MYGIDRTADRKNWTGQLNQEPDEKGEQPADELLLLCQIIDRPMAAIQHLPTHQLSQLRLPIMEVPIEVLLQARLGRHPTALARDILHSAHDGPSQVIGDYVEPMARYRFGGGQKDPLFIRTSLLTTARDRIDHHQAKCLPISAQSG